MEGYSERMTNQFSMCIILHLTVERSALYLVTEVSGFLPCTFGILFLVQQYFSLIEI